VLRVAKVIGAASAAVRNKPAVSGYAGRTPLSRLANNGVRRRIQDTGHEFDLPYRKRVNVWYGNLTDEFVLRVGDVMHAAMTTDGVKLVVQAMLGGGAAATHARRHHTSLSHRDMRFGFVFDVFHEPTAVARAAAARLQADMERVLARHAPDGSAHRLLWGSYTPPDHTWRDATDMRAVAHNYYDRARGARPPTLPADVYACHSFTKRTVDPDNVFYTRFFVQPADDDADRCACATPPPTPPSPKTEL